MTHGIAQNCTLSDNLSYGSSIGHRDTDNHLLNCTIENNHKAGLLFRMPLSDYRGAHRNLIESCLFRDNGFAEDGVGIELLGSTHDVILRDNRFADSGTGKQQIAIRISAEALGTQLENNHFDGMRENAIHLSE